MSLRVPVRLAPWIFALIVGISVGSVFLSKSADDAIGSIIIGALVCLTAAVGAVIVVRLSGHPVGWTLLALAAFAAAGGGAQSYATAALIDGRSLPGAHAAAWLTLWLAMPAVGLFVFLLLLFPDGNLPSPRWRIVARATVVGTVSMIVPTAIMPGPMPAIPREVNPLGIEGAGNLLTAISNAVSLIVPLCAVAAVVSQILRVRRARGDERQQIKLVVYAMVMVPLLIFVSQLVLPQGTSDAQWMEFAMNVLAGALIPVAIGIAILRRRLYDLDVLINRTLVYGALSAALASIYLGLVFALQNVLPVATESDLAIAASTLAVAALFRPMRARLQRFIDRRFYRTKYDSARALEGLARRLRDEIEITALRSDVLAVVGSTIQPSHASLWLREKR